MLNTRKIKKLFHYESEGELTFLFCAALHGSCLKITAYSKLCRSCLCNMAARKKFAKHTRWHIRNGLGESCMQQRWTGSKKA